MIKRIFASVLVGLGLAGTTGAQTLNAPRMALVSGGSFIQGSTEQPYAVTERAHAVVLSGFYLSETEITQALYKAVVGRSPSKFPGDDRPVESVSWLEAVAFCNALSERTGLTPAYTIIGSVVAWDRQAEGFRLPTEAEWEFAASGGCLGALGETPRAKSGYSGGTDADAVAWYDRNAAKTSHPVAKKQANELGLFDMSGNVWEWCWDWYGDYPEDPVTDPQGGPAGPGQKVMRGGAWFTPANLLRVTYRYWNLPTFKANSVGFRVARNAPAPVPAAPSADFSADPESPANDNEPLNGRFQMD